MNNVVLMGRLTKDLELQTSGDKSYLRFTLAVNRKFKKHEADFVDCVAFGKTAEIMAQYLSKGKQIAVEGRLEVSKYKKSDGADGYATNVIVDSFHFAEGKKADGEGFHKPSGEEEDDLPF
jgi:single-strand DNA-binding protein